MGVTKLFALILLFRLALANEGDSKGKPEANNRSNNLVVRMLVIQLIKLHTYRKFAALHSLYGGSLIQ